MKTDYTNKSYDEINNWLKSNLTEERYLHSLGTMECAVELARKYGLDDKKAKTAGLLHDCAKCFTNEKLLTIIEVDIPSVEPSELVNYKTLHAPVSAHIAQKDFGVSDPEIISAIRWHTLGRVNMSDFEKIIFLADKIERNTRPKDYRDSIAKLLEEENGLNKALLKCFSETVKSLVNRRLAICHITIDVYNELLILCKE